MAKKQRTRINIPAYRRNVRSACRTAGIRVPNAYTTDIAPNGDFIVRLPGGAIAARLIEWEPFLTA
jgi:hypothetical protein